MFNKKHASAFTCNTYEPYNPADSSNPFITPAAAFSHLMSNPLDPQHCIDVFQYQFDTLAIQSTLGAMANVFSDALYQEISNLHKNLDHPFPLLDAGNLLDGNLLCHKGAIYHWAVEKFDYEIPEWRCFFEKSSLMLNDHHSNQSVEGGMGHE